MSNIKDLVKQENQAHDEIVEKVCTILEKSEYLKSKRNKLDQYEYDYLSANDMRGVDIRVDFSMDSLLGEGQLEEVPMEHIHEALEKHLEEHCMYWNPSDEELYQSTADEIWVLTHDSNVMLGSDFKKYHDDFHLWLLIEEHMEESGYFPGIYSQNYHGYVDEYKFDEKYHEHFPDDKKPKLKKISQFLNLYQLKEDCEDRGIQSLEELPEPVWNLVPREVRDLHYESPVNIHDVIELGLENVVIKIETDQELNIKSAELDEKGEHGWFTYDLTIQLTPNSLRFIMSDDESKNGGIYGLELATTV